MSNLHLKFPFLQPQRAAVAKQGSSSRCHLSAHWYLEAAAHLTDKALMSLVSEPLSDPALPSPGRQQWCPQLAGSCGYLAGSLHLPTGNSSIITRISGFCIWLPRPGSRSSKWWVILSRLWFCQERLGQMIHEVPFNLAVYNSMKKRSWSHWRGLWQAPPLGGAFSTGKDVFCP